MEEADWIDAGVEGVRFGLADYDAPDGGGTTRFFCVYRASGFDAATRASLEAAGYAASSEDGNLFGLPHASDDVSGLREGLSSAFPAAVRSRVPARTATPRPVAKVPPFPERTGPAPAAPTPPAAVRPPFRPVAPSRPVSPGRTKPAPTEPPAAAEASALAVRPAPPVAGPVASAVSAATAASSSRRPTRVGTADMRPVAFEIAPLAAGQINPFQMKYVPQSGVGAPIAAIPLNLAGPTAAALARVVARHGDVDAFVAGRLEWTPEEMAGFLSPEQVDAVALAMDSSERGQGFVLADATGLGKGRVLAAVCRGVVLAGRPALFVTEKENLFSDLWRDIVDIGSADLFGRPFMLNDEASIVDGTSAEVVTVHEAWAKKEVQAVLKRKRLPEGCRLMMATYSQFNKVGSVKAEFLKAVAKGNHLMCDESHNAVGDSATSVVLSEAMDEARAVTYSSATFARHAANLAAYKRLFPASMRSSDLMEVLSTGGQSISEALSQMLAEDGAYLRREHDLSGLSIRVVDDAERLGRNRAFADALSPVLMRVAKLSREVNSIVQVRNEGAGEDDGRPRKGGREFWSSGNFGARLGLVVRQFAAALTVDLCVERSVAALLEGKKPVVVVESTMESLMRELASDKPEAADEALPDDEVAETLLAVDAESEEGAAPTAVEGAEEPKPPTFRDALNLLVDRTMQMSVRRGKADPEKVDVDDPVLVADAAGIKALVAAFPELPLSPIDDVREGIERASRALAEEGRLERPWVVEEISARSLSVVEGRYVRREAPERVTTVARFQNGLSDGIILTRAASTGLSLHASEKVSDRRVRVMMELQIPSNVVERVQFWGRVKRRGQVCEPEFESLTCGLELQMRQLAVQNKKVADLSANVTASAASATAMKVPDLIDPIGNAIARRMLEEQPRLADDMHVAVRLKDMEKAEQELYHVNKLLQRLVLLPSEEQGRVYRELVAAYDDAVREMKAKGQSPRGARELPGEWAVVGRETFEPGDPRDGGVFGRPVSLTTIETMRDRRPLGFDAVAEMVAKATDRLAFQRGAVEGHPFAVQMAAIERGRPEILTAAMSKKHSEFFTNWKEALKAQGANSVKLAADRLDRLCALLRCVRPGNDIVVVGDDGTETGVVVDVRAPSDAAASHLPGRWTIRYVVPGDEAPREISAAAAIRDNSVSVLGSDGMSKATRRRFDAVPRGLTPERRRLLDGNPVRAVISARKAGWGSMATWRDAGGRLNRAVLVPRNCSVDIDPALTGRTNRVDVALAVLRGGGMIWTNPDRPEGGARLQVEGAEIQVEVPADKRLFAQYDAEAVRAAVGGWKGTGTTRFNSRPVAAAESVLVAFAEAGHAFNYDGRYRRVANEASAAAFREEEPEPVAMRM